MDAERQAFAARIQELEATLQAERGGFIGRISELARAPQRLVRFRRWMGLSRVLAARRWMRGNQ
jgi:hypothetical protein